MEDKQLINNNNNNNNNIVSTTTNQTTNLYHYYKLLTNRYYRGMIYILLTKGYTYNSELQKIYPINSRQYINNLKQKGIVRKKTLTKEMKDFIKHSNITLNEKQINNIVVYSLTPKAKEFFMQEQIYSAIIEDLDEELTYYENLIERYKQRVQELKEKQDYEERRGEHIARLKGIITPDMRRRQQEEYQRWIHNNY